MLKIYRWLKENLWDGYHFFDPRSGLGGGTIVGVIIIIILTIWDKI